jgi:hypothetical protein
MLLLLLHFLPHPVLVSWVLMPHHTQKYAQQSQKMIVPLFSKEEPA